LQKFIRFRAKKVLIEGKLIPTPVAVAVAASLLFACKGGFSPELQLFTRGPTAAFKRLAVILLEDAWPAEEQTPACIEALLVFGLYCQQVTSYQPPKQVIKQAVLLAAKASVSNSCIAWREGSNSVDRQVVLQPDQNLSMFNAAKLLRKLRSFQCDMDMFDKVAQMGDKTGCLKLIEGSSQLECMPLCHIVDQHCFRGIGHCMGEGSGNSFAERFCNIFQDCTGYNPRLQKEDGMADFESRPSVKRVRFAQECTDLTFPGLLSSLADCFSSFSSSRRLLSLQK
jgi:hypothetical protein